MATNRKQRIRKQRRMRGERARGGQQFAVVYEDNDMVVVNKQAGILSVPFEGARSPNVLQLLNRLLETKRQHALVVHRIDRYTSGLLVFAKHTRAREKLIEQFMAHSPLREYVALVEGSLKPRSGELTHHMRLSKNGFQQKVIRKKEPGSTRAKLMYSTLAESDGLSLLSIRLDTGLKNQIRVQLSEVGHPIVGDQAYGTPPEEGKNPEISHQALHASRLGLVHPISGEKMEFVADLPYDMKSLIKRKNLLEAFVNYTKR